MSLDLHLLRTFCVVAEEENLSRAAERLYLSAPSVSAHIKMLEDELGVSLFNRSSRGMTLTEAGHALWEDAENVLKQIATLRRKASSLSDDVSGILRIGINNPPDTLFIDEIIATLSEQFPTLRFECTFGASQNILGGLRRDEFDIGFFEGAQSNAELDSILLEQRPLVLISPLSWAETLREASPAQLQEYPWVFASEGCSYFKFAQEWQQTHGLRIEGRIRSGHEDHSTMSFVARDLGLSIVSEQVLNHSQYRDRVEIIPQLKGSVPLSLGYKKLRKGEAMLQAAINAVQSIWTSKAAPAGA